MLLELTVAFIFTANSIKLNVCFIHIIVMSHCQCLTNNYNDPKNNYFRIVTYFPPVFKEEDSTEPQISACKNTT